MGEFPNNISGETLGRLADESGLAIAIVDESARQVAVSNNNSICRNLNPGSKFSPACSRFCGLALEKATEAGTMIGFECHAGLDCRAMVGGTADKRFVAIVGRTFLKAENYRKATERAIIGDWGEFAPAEFFENILLTGSSDALTKTAQKVEVLLNEIRTEQEDETDIAAPIELESEESPDDPYTDQSDDTVYRVGSQEEPELPETSKDKSKVAGAMAWRSFFGSILKTDYAQATSSILEFLARQYDLSALVWLEKKGERFANTAAFGGMEGRKARLGISPGDHRLVEVFQKETSLELAERTSDPSEAPRIMNLFPIGVGEEISAAIAILGSIEAEDRRKQIARFCHSIAPQLEILRLRNEVSERDAIANAVRAFGDSLKNIEEDDFWHHLTQTRPRCSTRSVPRC